MAIEQIRVRSNLPGAKPGTVLSPPYLTDEMNVPHGVGRAAQSTTLTLSADPADGTTYSYLIEGELITHTVGVGDGGAGEEDAAAVALAAVHNANPLARGLMTASAAAGVVTLTGNVYREAFDVENVSGTVVATAAAAADGGSFPVAVATYLTADGLATTVKPAGDLGAVLRGISRYMYDEEQAVKADRSAMAIPPRRDVVYVRRGVVAVDTAPTAARGGLVYVGTDAGPNAETGKFYAAAGAGRTVLPQTAAEWDGPNRLLLKLV